MSDSTDDPSTNRLPATIPFRLLLEAMVEAGEPLEITFPSGPLRLTVDEMRMALAPDEEDSLL